jgi:dolichyl-phosphate beta-glucosyltransferase
MDRLFDIAASDLTVVIGSRSAADTVIQVHQAGAREWLGWLFNRWAQLLVTPGISDTQCGAKAAQTTVWFDILEHTREPGFAWDTEVLAVARRLGLQIEEVGVEWSHDPATRVRILRDGVVMALTVLRIAARCLRITPQRHESLEPEHTA